MPTVAEILSAAPGATYLAANAVDKSVLFNKGRLNPILPQQIYSIYFVLKKIYDLNPTYTGLIPTANYLWEIMGRYGIAAGGISGGGGSVTPILPSIIPDPLIFQVQGSTPVTTLSSSADLSAFGYIGFNILFSRGGIVQSTVDFGGSYYSWDKTTAILYLINGAAQEDEAFNIYPIT